MKQKQLSTRVIRRIEIKSLLKQGYSVSEVARMVKVHRNAVRNVAKKNQITDKKRPGRPCKTMPRTKAIIKRSMKEKIGASEKPLVNSTSVSGTPRQGKVSPENQSVVT